MFARFKTFADFEAGVPMAELVEQIHRASRVYRAFIERRSQLTGPIDRLRSCSRYRTGVLESEVIKPLVLCLLDPEQDAIPAAQFVKALEARRELAGPPHARPGARRSSTRRSSPNSSPSSASPTGSGRRRHRELLRRSVEWQAATGRTTTRSARN